MPGSTQLLVAGVGLCVALAMCSAPAQSEEAAGPKPATSLRGERVPSPPVQHTSIAAWRAEREELRAVHARGVETVTALVARMQGLPQGPERRALESRVAQVKRESRVQYLATIARFARARGDEGTAREAERQAALLAKPAVVSPPATVAQPVEKSAAAQGVRP